MTFLKNLFTVVLGFFIACSLSIVCMIVAISVIGASASPFKRVSSTIKIKNNSILKLKLGVISEKSDNFNIEGFEFTSDKVVSQKKIIEAIKTAKTDAKISGIVLPNNFLLTSYPKIKVIRDALEDFKQSKKFIYAYGDVITQKDYYLKSIADSIFLNPKGLIEFKGLSMERMYYKDFQEKTGIKFEVIRKGKFKSAVEPFLSNEMSAENRTQMTELLLSLWNSIVLEISTSRDLSISFLNEIANTLGSSNTDKALNNKIIDGVFYYDEFESFLKNKINIDESEEINIVKLEDYIRKVNKNKIFKRNDIAKIAVIYAVGDIAYQNLSNTINPFEMTKVLRKVLKDESIKGVVIRVNSPGGDALASEIIWREIERLKEKKPVYVSMSDLAASGGYYIASGADKIFAEPTTITGSIGVFGLIPNLKGLVNKMGINAQYVETHDEALMYSPFNTVSKKVKEAFRENLDLVYDTFLERVAQGRGMSVENVHKIAQGRVWSGVDAKKHRLVDYLGDLQTTIDSLAKHPDLELEEYNVVEYPKNELSIAEFLMMYSNIKISSEEVIKSFTGEHLYKVYNKINALENSSNIQMALPYEFSIK